MVYIDVKRRLGAGEVMRTNLAPSSVGTTAQGTLTAAKVFGTLAQLNIGSVVVSWGSLGTASGRISRYKLERTGQGTFGSVNIRAVGSVTGTLYGRKTIASFGSVLGTFYARKMPFGSVQGTFSAHQVRTGARYGAVGSVGSFTRATASNAIGAYGSYGTQAGRLDRTFLTRSEQGTFGTLNIRTYSAGSVGSYSRIVASRGSIQGTASMHRLMPTSFPGTFTVRTAGTMHGYFAAPPKARELKVVVLLTPGATGVAAAIIRQSLQGTVDAATIGAAGVATTATLQGIVLPGHGSYALGTQGQGAAATTVVKHWREYDP